MLPLETAWFLLVGVLLAGYAILDGFDLGVGMLHPFVAKDDTERRKVINAIAPGLGRQRGLAAARRRRHLRRLPAGLRHGVLGLLRGARAAAGGAHRAGGLPRVPRQAAGVGLADDVGLGLRRLAPSCATLLFGVALGNILHGVPLDAGQEYAGTFLGLLNPFSLLVGVMAVALFLLQGAAWLSLKTEGELRERARSRAKAAWVALLVLWAVATVASRFAAPRLWQAYANPLAWAAAGAVPGGDGRLPRAAGAAAAGAGHAGLLRGHRRC